MKLQESVRAITHAAKGVFSSQSNGSRKFVRCMATQAQTSISQLESQENTVPVTTSASTAEIQQLSDRAPIYPLKHVPPPNPFIVPAQCTLYSFPELAPTGFASYPSTHLLLPLRRDLLHRAVVYEADGKRQGTASTKWRDEVAGSGRKLRPQKGSGRARLGDRKSPMLRGGGVAFGPKPRDFSTDLPRKIYDLAWRTAFSYRYRRGELFIVRGNADLEGVPRNDRVRYIQEMLNWHSMGAKDSRTLIVTNEERRAISDGFKEPKLAKDGALMTAEELDVKALLHLGRVVIEQTAFERLLSEHELDLVPHQRLASGKMSRRLNADLALPASIPTTAGPESSAS